MRTDGGLHEGQAGSFQHIIKNSLVEIWWIWFFFYFWNIIPAGISLYSSFLSQFQPVCLPAPQKLSPVHVAPPCPSPHPKTAGIGNPLNISGPLVPGEWLCLLLYYLYGLITVAVGAWGHQSNLLPPHTPVQGKWIFATQQSWKQNHTQQALTRAAEKWISPGPITFSMWENKKASTYRS